MPGAYSIPRRVTPAPTPQPFDPELARQQAVIQQLRKPAAPQRSPSVPASDIAHLGMVRG